MQTAQQHTFTAPHQQHARWRVGVDTHAQHRPYPRPALCRSQASYRAAADPVVSTSWLAQHLEEVSVLDVRGHVDTVLQQPGVEKSTYRAGYDDYLEGHVPGAVFWDWTRDGINASSAVPVQLEQQADLLAAGCEAKGVSSDKPVVCYDGGDGMLSARVWWMLTVAGHPAVHVLEGGWAKWKAEGRKTELYEPCTLKLTSESCFEADMQLQLRATLEDLAALQQQAPPQQVLLLDTRNAQQFSGEVRRGPRGGRIPGAVSLPRADLLDPETGGLRPLEEQQQLLQQAGVVLPAADTQPQQRLVVYCNGGVAACTAALALHRLGHRRWAVYDGSWNEYSAAIELPVELPK